MRLHILWQASNQRKPISFKKVNHVKHIKSIMVGTNIRKHGGGSNTLRFAFQPQDPSRKRASHSLTQKDFKLLETPPYDILQKSYTS